MPSNQSIAILSDIHYAGAAEKQRGWAEGPLIRNPLLRLAVKLYRHFIWRRDPFAHNHLLECFLKKTDGVDHVFANGDYSCDTAFVGLSDEPSFASAAECVGLLRNQFGEKLQFTLGDHELGKMSLFGGRGGMRLASWRRSREELCLAPFWNMEIGRYVVVGVTSSLLALPVYEPETLPEERENWRELRAEHLEHLRGAFKNLAANQRVILLCHDPTALPFLWRDDIVRSKLAQVEKTVIGHLHSEFYLWKSRWLAGMPRIPFLGNSIRRMSAALNEARHWNSFNILLCPALAGIELLKDGGYYELELDRDARQSPRWHRHRWNSKEPKCG
jgi:hypothetical protein